uniref:Phosphatidylinositol N-acetylglucosaminyltransferase subunit H conserved domain-containing protein n=1 Tax=Leptobrachium leishanense TaxID=445787 RepID=A0A8C5R5X1_9ANUR
MEDRTFSDIEGGKIIVQERLFSKTCKEFNIICPKMSVRSVVTATFTAWVAAYAMYAYTENNMVLSATTVSTIIGLLFYLHFVKIDQESLLLIGSLGIQMTLTYTSGKESTEFIEMHKIKDVVINEAIFMQKAIYYLCILLEDPSEPKRISSIVPLFQSAKPNLNCLVQVYNSCQEILSERKSFNLVD